MSVQNATKFSYINHVSKIENPLKPRTDFLPNCQALHRTQETSKVCLKTFLLCLIKVVNFTLPLKMMYGRMGHQNA